MISADQAMYRRSAPARTGSWASRSTIGGGSRRRRCSIRPCRTQGSPDTRRPPRRRHGPRPIPPRGFATRAIRAAHRQPVVDQRPTSVPIYQTVTFSSGDAEELGAVLTGQRPGLRLRPHRQPDRRRRSAAAVAELEGAEAGFALRVRDGRDPRGARVAPVGRRPGRRDAGVVRHDAGPARRASSPGSASTSTFVDVTDLAAVEAALAAAPTRVLYAETIANPTIVVADHAALADLAHRHGATYVVDNTFASPYLCRPIELGADLVVESATKYLAGHSDVLAGVAVGRRDLVDGVRDVQVDTGASARPACRRSSRCAASRRSRSGWSATRRRRRHSPPGSSVSRACRASSTRPWPAIPSARSRAAQLRAGGGMLAFELAGGRDAGDARSSTP